MIGIYKIINPTGKIYIGQSRDIKRRWKYYYSNIVTVKQHIKLYRSILKYGIENHEFKVIEECCIEQLDEREIYWINYYNSIEQGLNIGLGGRGGNGLLNKGKKHKPITINKMKQWWNMNKKSRPQEVINKIKQTKQNNERERNHILGEARRDHLQTLDGGQDGNGGRDDTVAIKEAGAENTDKK